MTALPLAAMLVHAAVARAQPPSGDRVRLRLDTAQTVAVLSILDAVRAGRSPADADWQRLFASQGYVRLKDRESAMRRPFTDSAFRAFVLSDTLGARATALRQALSAWGQADLNAAALRVLGYLPSEARIAATVYIVIKPQTNSFVWDVQRDPAIFLYLDPEVTRAKFANTVAHELHHIGFASIRDKSLANFTSLADSVRPAAEWMAAFGEGFAMLAAAGGPDTHPHAMSLPAERAQWDGDVANFTAHLRALETFFLDIVDGRLTNADSIRAAASTFYGVQGPWYTVGHTMAAMVEKRFGREELIRCMVDPRALLQRYNEIAATVNASRRDSLPLWSPRLLRALGA